MIQVMMKIARPRAVWVAGSIGGAERDMTDGIRGLAAHGVRRHRPPDLRQQSKGE